MDLLENGWCAGEESVVLSVFVEWGVFIYPACPNRSKHAQTSPPGQWGWVAGP